RRQRSRAQGRFRISALRAIPPHDGVRKRRLRAARDPAARAPRRGRDRAAGLAVDPKVLLLDEPFGALDAKVRQELRRWLRRLHDEIKITSVFVTHDQEEALELANRIVVMNQGR